MKNIFLPLLLILTAVALFGCSSKAPDNLGVRNGLLAQCPDSPNCVSSQADDPGHRVEPFRASGDRSKVMTDLAASIESMFGAKVVAVKGNYLHAEYTSRIFRFVDDLECWYDEDAKVVHVRSASRVGRSDMGANRDRVEELRKRFEAR